MTESERAEVRNKTIIGLKSIIFVSFAVLTCVRNKTIIGLKYKYS